MAVPDGYNTVPSFRYLEQIAGIGGIMGNVYFVDSGTGADTNDGLTIETALATLDAAIGKCTANNGDIIFVAPGHTETWTTTGAKVVADVAGVSIIGLGQGANRPTFSFGHTGTTWTISAASVTLANLLLVSAVDSITTFATISGADCTLIGIETRDTTDIEVIDAFTVTGDRLTVKQCFHNGYTGGNANARVFKLTGVDNALFEGCRFMTKVTTAVINFTGTACTNVVIKNCDFLITSTTNLSKTVVDTIGGSTWEVRDCFDLGAGAIFSGGSGGALAKDDVGAISALIGTLANSGGTATLGGILGDVANVSVATSLAKLGTIANSGGTATLGAILGDLANVTIATWLQKIGTLANTGGTATLGGILGDVANISAASRLDSGTKKTTIADGTTIPNNSQAAAGLLATATDGAVLIEEIIWQRGADNFAGPTNYEISTDNDNGLTGAAAPNGVALLAKFNANKTGVLSIDGSTKQIPFVLESGKKLYIHGDDAATSNGGATDFYIKYRRLAAGAYLA